MEQPNYREYNLDELYDALSHIDRVAYPDRVRQIEAEIASRTPAGLHPFHSPDATEPGPRAARPESPTAWDRDGFVPIAPTDGPSFQTAFSISAAIPGLSFKRSALRIILAILLLQSAGLWLAGLYGFGLEEYPNSFYFYSQLIGVAWYACLMALVWIDSTQQQVSAAAVFRLDFNRVNKTHLRQVFKYFAGCALFVIPATWLLKESELNLSGQSEWGVALAFLTTVILAPFCEEIAFRGYLYNAMFSHFKRKRERLVVNAMIFAGAHVFVVSLLFGASVPYYIFILGYLLALLYEETRSLVPSIMLHTLNNGLVFCLEIFRVFEA